MQDGGRLELNATTTGDASIDNAFTAMDVSYGNNIINQITTAAYPTKIYTVPSLIYNLESPLYIAAGDTITTGSDGEAIYIIGNDAYLHRDRSVVTLTGNALSKGLRVLNGKLLSVFGKGENR